MDRDEIARILEEIADLLELQEENPFKVRAYRNAARSLLNMHQDLNHLIDEGKLTDIEGIGDHIAEKITQLVKKGRMPFYEQLKRAVPQALLKLMQVQGLGPKKVQILYKKLGIKTIPALKKAVKEGKIAKLKGFGAKTAKNILDSLSHQEKYQARHLWWDAMEIASPILKALKELKGVKFAEIAGSLRRKLETIGDLDFLVSAKSAKPIMQWFTSQSLVTKVLAKGETKASVMLKEGIQADLRIVSESEFGYALIYFTGSKQHNIKLREMALKRGWTLSEYGMESLKQKRPVISKKNVDEEEIYRAFGLSYIPPELRENQGEFEAAAKKRLPQLVEEKDLCGAFHTHTAATDGRNSLLEMVEAAEKMGWEYIGISDHSKSAFQANGMSEERLLQQIEEIHKLNASKKFRTHIFTGVECDILKDGSLDFSNKVLKQLDYCIVSVHSSFQQDEKTMTKRLIKAIEHPSCTMVGHLTGRLLLKRESYAVNVTKVIDACVANKKIMELNANPQRLDMDWRYWHAAAEKGLLCSINTDAHATDQLAYVQTGINIARKGWLEKKNIINTRSLKEIKKLLDQMHP